MVKETSPEISRPANFKELALRGARWFSAARVLAELAAFGSSVIVARLVAPGEVGSAVIALGVVMVAAAFFSECFSTPLVRQERVGRAHLQVTLLLGLLSGIAMTLFFALVVSPLARFFPDPQVAELIRLAAPVFVACGLDAVPTAVLQRRLAFRTLGVVELASLVAGALVTVAAALSGLNAPALVYGAMTATAVHAALGWIIVFPPPPRWRPGLAGSLFSFGVPAGLSSLVSSLWRNVDYMIIGASLGAYQAGIYWRGFQLGYEYQGKISRVALQLALPVYSRLETVDRIKGVRGRIVRLHTAALFGPLLLLIPLAPVLVPWLYGPAWAPAVLPTQMLAVAGLVAVVLTGTGPLLLAVGRPRLLLAVNVVAVCTFATFVTVAAPHGLTAICLAVVGFQALNFLGVHLLLARLFDLGWRSIVGDLAPAGCASVALLIVAVPLTLALRGAGAPALVVLAVVVSSGAAVYVAVLRSVFPAAWLDLVSLVRRPPSRDDRPVAQASPSSPAPTHVRTSPAPPSTTGVR